MYILASDLFEKDKKYIIKARNSCCVWGIVSFNYIFLQKYQIIIYIYTSEILKTSVKNRFFGTQYLFVFVWAGKKY